MCSRPGIKVRGKGYEVRLAGEWGRGTAAGQQKLRCRKEGRGWGADWLGGLTDGGFFELGHVFS